MRLSGVIPVFNELATLERVLATMARPDRHIVLHERNQGKRASLRTGFAHVAGEYVIPQDADLEYDPQDYVKLLAEADRHHADVVYGSRFTGERPVMACQNVVGNRVLTALTNLLYGSSLTDMETATSSCGESSCRASTSNPTGLMSRRS